MAITAIVGAGVVGAAGSIGGASIQANAAQNAANTNLQMYQQTRSDLLPYMNFGKSALPQMGNLLGLNGPNGSAQALSTLQNYPGYQWAFGQGMQALDQSAASRGLLLSGGQLAATQQYGQGMADQLLNQYYSQLMGVSQLGANAAAGVGTQGTQAAGQAGQAQYAGGTALASGYAGLANNLGGAGLLAYQMSNPGMGGATGAPDMSDFYGGVYSDVRLKEDVERVGTLDSGLPVYTFRYKGSALPQIGVIAQDVEKVAPHAVREDPVTNFKRVDYRRISQLPPAGGWKEAA